MKKIALLSLVVFLVSAMQVLAAKDKGEQGHPSKQKTSTYE